MAAVPVMAACAATADMGAARTRLGLLLRSTLAAAVVLPSCAALA
eukprot:SAG31_NODE_35360_length_324_cov_0.617778_1_plen_44_part_01